MKLFSRKALVAGAAAVALSFAGTSAAVAAEPAKSSVPGLFGSSSSSSDEKKDDNDVDPENKPEDPENKPEDPEDDPKDPNNPEGDNGLSSQDPKDISAWISVFTAVIGALGALFSFATKYLGFKL